MQQQLSGNRTAKALGGLKNKSADTVKRNEPKQNQSKKSGNTSRIDELLARKSPMYVEVLNDGDESDDDISVEADNASKKDLKSQEQVV